MKLIDLEKQQLILNGKIQENIKKVLKHGKYILGPEVNELEGLLASYTGTKHCITCANGTDALQISLMAIGVGKNDEVITVSNTAVPTVSAIVSSGAKPVFVDINEKDFLIDVEKVKKKINKKTKVIIPVNLYGQ